MTTLAEVLEQVKAMTAEQKAAMDVAHHHHERYDGKGYPDGLAGD
mgnify:CR=1 FL=1